MKKDVRADEAGVPRLAVGGIVASPDAFEVTQHFVVPPHRRKSMQTGFLQQQKAVLLQRALLLGRELADDFLHLFEVRRLVERERRLFEVRNNVELHRGRDAGKILQRRLLQRNLRWRGLSCRETCRRENAQKHNQTCAQRRPLRASVEHALFHATFLLLDLILFSLNLCSSY